MRDWKRVQETNTLGEQMDIINDNSDSSAFLDNVVDDIISNGYIYTGKETIGGKYIAPLTNVELTGIVPSALYFDNFRLFFRTTNKVIDLNNFPVDLHYYNNGKPQFLYIRDDLSYRVSDYMYGQVNELLLARFIINTDGTWNQLYVIPQRATSPVYHTGEEFYDIEGLNVRSPGGLELSTTEGTVKRSGIEFNDIVSPDIYKSTRLESTRVPIRYVTTSNIVDYTQQPTYNIITNKYMDYNGGIKLQTQADEMIRVFLDSIYVVPEYTNEKAEELHTAITLQADLADRQAIVKTYTDKIDELITQANSIISFITTNSLAPNSITAFSTQINTINTYMTNNLKGTAISTSVTELQTVAIRQVGTYFEDIDDLLQDVTDEMDEISYPAGTIRTVTAGKFTIQRILWDIYEDCFILQYGNTVYDTFDDATLGSSLLDFPAPYGKTIYIPLAIIIVKSGTSSINNDPDTVILTRKWIYVDETYEGTADMIARTKADSALSQIQDIIGGTTPVGKANSLKCTVSGQTQYKDGDYYLNYNNLLNKISVVNDLTHSVYSSLEALSAYQGYLLQQNKVNKNGDTMTGTLSAQAINPKTTNAYGLGTSSLVWNDAYIKNPHVTNVLYYGTGSTTRYIYSGGTSTVYDIRAMAKSSYSAGSMPNGSLVFCW